MAAPKLRFKEFDADWISNKIIDLADYVDYRGKTPKKVESGILLVTAKNIKQGYLDYSVSQEFIEPSDFDEVMRRGKVELNDVLITTEAPLGNVASVDRTDIALAQRVIKYRGKIDLLDNLFLKQKFLSESFQEILKSKATGGTVQGIKGSVLHQIPLIVPSKQEQTKIASFLSAVDEKISQLTQKHALLSQYKQGMMQKLFSQQIRFKADDGSEFGEWENISVKEIFDVTRGQVLAVSNTVSVADADYKYPVFSSQTKQKGLMGFYKKYLFEDALTWTTDGANAGDVNFRKGKFYCTNVCGVLLSKKGYANLCIAEILNKVTHKYVSYVGNPKLMNNVMSEIPITIPINLEEQTKIANFLSAIDQKIEVVAQQIEQAKQWKKGLLQQMFV